MKKGPLASRREFFTLSAAAALSISNPRELLAGALEMAADKSGSPINPDQALRELIEGNQRFRNGKTTGPRRSPADFSRLAAAQYPEAIIVSCADSRVAPEILFDVGLGDIFVVRVAGNVVTGAGVTVKGSIEYAVAELNAPLIMVLGHTACGAVKAAKQHIDAKDSLPGAIDGLVELVKPAVAQSKDEPGDPLYNAIRKNVQLGVEQLKTLEPILAPKVKEGKLKVVGAVYDLGTGEVKMV
jgi:carbonic anhydrase